MSATTSAASSPPPGHLAYRDTSTPTDTESDSSDNSGDEIEQSLASIPSIPLRGRGAEVQCRASLGRKRGPTTSRAVIKRRVVSNSSILGMTEDMSTLQTSPMAADEVDSCLTDDLTDLTDYKVHPAYPANDLHCAKKRRPYDSKTARYVAGPSKRAHVQAPRYHRAFKKRPLTLDMARALKRRGPDLSAWDASEKPTDADEMLKEMAARAGYKLLPLSPRSHAAAVSKLDASQSGPSTSSDFVDDVLLASAPSDDDESELELPDTPTPSPRKKIKTTPAPTPRRNMKSAAKGKGRAEPLSKGKARAEPVVVAEAPAPAPAPEPTAAPKLEIINPVLKRAARKGKARADTLSSVRLTHGASARQRYAAAVPAAASNAAPRGVKQMPRERHYMFTLAHRPASRQIKRPRLVFARRRVALRRPARLRLGSKAQTRRDKNEVPLDTAGNGYWAAAKAHLVISRTRRGLYRRYQERTAAPSGAVASGIAGPSTTASTSSARVPQHGVGDVTFADGNDDDDLVDELLHEPDTDRLAGRKRTGASTSRSDGDARRDVRNRARHAEEFDNYHVARRAYKAALAEHRRDPDARRQAQAMRHLQAVAADREARYEQNRVDAELRCLEAENAQDEDVADEAVDVDVDDEAAVETLHSETVDDEADMEADLNEEPDADESDVEVESSEEDTVADAVDESMAEPTPEPTVPEPTIEDGPSSDDAASVVDDAEDVAAILAAAAEPLSPPPRYEYPFEPIISPVPRQLPRPAPRARRNAPVAEPPRYVRELYNRRSPSPPPPYNAQTDRETVLAPVFLPEPVVTAPVLPLGPPLSLRRHRDPSPAPSETSDDLHAPGTWPTRRRRAPLPRPSSHVYDVEMGELEDEVAQPPAGTFSAIRRWLGF